MQKELTRAEAQVLFYEIDVFTHGDKDSPTLLSKTVIERCTANKFELAANIEDIKKFSEKVTEEFEKAKGIDLKKLDDKTEGEKIKLQDALEDYYANHKLFSEFLHKKIKVDLEEISLRDLKNCVYDTGKAFKLYPHILVKEKNTEAKIKPSAN